MEEPPPVAEDPAARPVAPEAVASERDSGASAPARLPRLRISSRNGGSEPVERSTPEVATGDAEPAPVDPEVERVRAEAPAGIGGSGVGGASGTLSADRLAPGPQSSGLTVQVRAPSTVNLDIPAEVVITLQNTGKSEAGGVEVYYPVPDGVEVLSTQPETGKPANGRLTWSLGYLSPGSDRTFKVKIKPTKAQLIDHVAWYSLQGGARAKMVVNQPKLKVELTAFPERAILKGKPVTFRITVMNTGSGPARNVFVQAKLSAGLKHQQDSSTIEVDAGTIQPGETVAVNDLQVDAVAGGAQECEVSATSPDVAKVAEESRAVRKVAVVEPGLKVTLAGHKSRITNTQAAYRLTVENPGTAPAKDVRLTAFLPQGGKVYVPKDAKFDPRTRRLSWAIGSLDPQSPKTFDFKVTMGGVGRYEVDASASSGLISAKDSCVTDVTAIADVNFDVTERTRAIDVGETTDFEIRVRNTGSKAASNLLFNAKVTDNLEYVGTDGTDKQGERDPTNPTMMRFPAIPRLEPNKELLLTIRVKGVKPGIADCRVSLVHEDSGDQPLNRDAPVRIMEPGP